ncbi:MAG: RNA pseudouridine synthase [bacterium]|uniref:RNA pseudouridine synthase n=1 Tax=Candidatus Aphodosoma intestinipullorum TaxID=2840674 RepID=A0A940DLJ9_9BACT|nr:RNA pseudouridine synthase [Candidatus Aphodosoma intestinipullorum]
MGLDPHVWQSSTLHPLPDSTTGIAMPERFTYPFNYTPHPLAAIAAEELMRVVALCGELHPSVDQGKMFGILVVSTQEGSLAYLAAFSGNIGGRNAVGGFVPPVYDLLNPHGFFIREEQVITALNHRIRHLEESDEYSRLKAHLEAVRTEAAASIARAKALSAEARQQRAELRMNGLSDEENEILIRESQHEKAELHRLKAQWKVRTDEAEARLENCTQEINRLKNERRQRSVALQMKLFCQFRMLNARGETRDLCDLFAPTAQRIPPAGTGECAAPKLLQYAYQHRLHPLCMAEFWWGECPAGEIRRHGTYYPACIGKCKPILDFMLQGLDVDPDPLSLKALGEITVIYEDDSLIAIDKPSGMLSVPGKDGTLSAEERLLRLHPDLHGLYPVHRLDMATSGVLLFAKSPDIQSALHRQFRERRVEKRYIALLDGTLHTPSGTISLPLRSDYTNRPRQTVDYAHGKEAETRYRTLGRYEGRTLVEFIPLTGRTHQLRIHAAHPDGLNAPICGDTLYGHTPVASSIASTHIRLCLHALTLRLDHPVTAMPLTITSRHNLFPIPGFTL